jgi:glutathione peroxidase
MTLRFPLLPVLALLAGTAAADCPPLLKTDMKPLRGGDPVNLCETYRGKVILAVNTASQCGFTPQFKGLEALYQKYKDRGLVVLGFPSNDFHQEFSEAEETAKMCYINYGVTFPMFSKSAVKGDDANPFFKQLAEQSGVSPKWNFYKYLISPDGKVVDTYTPMTAPDDKALQDKIEGLLSASAK